MALTDTTIRNAKPREKPFKLSDGGGLTLIVNPDSSKWWRLRYRIHGREKMLSLGVYPDVSLKQARDRRDQERRLISGGIDPARNRQAQKMQQANTFKVVALEWLKLKEKAFAAATYEKAKWMLESLLLPYLGSHVITHITAPDILTVLRRLEDRGKHETAHRTKQQCGAIFRYAIATGRAERDPSADLRGALAPVVTEHRAAITEPKKIGQLLRSIDGFDGHVLTVCALKLAPLVFVRPGELRAAEWAELDLENSEWRIAAERMKMREQHIVPLSRQAVAVFRELEALTGKGRYVFPSLRTAERPMSENTINGALRRLGYSKEEMTAHGFRALASTRLNEQGYLPDVIELQLAHAERNKVRAAYNRAAHLDERRKMMQEWADYLDGLKAGAKIVQISAVA